MSAVFPFEVHPWQLQCGELSPDRILDMRDPPAFAKAHLHASENVPYHQFQVDCLPLLLPEQTVLVVDPGGARAAEMATWLRRQGVQAGYLSGGLAAWTGTLHRPRQRSPRRRDVD